MKKLIIAVLAVMLAVFTISGCGVEDPLNPVEQPTDEATSPSEKEISYKDYEDSLDGMYKYFVDKAIFPESEAVKMSAELIGAQEGRKYSFSIGRKPVAIEFYSYDLSKLNDTAKEVLQSVKDEGSFEILNLGKTEAVLSKNGKYLLVYSDAELNAKNPKEEHTARKAAVLDAFNGFYPDN